MGRTGRRVSRALIALLVLIVVIAAITSISKLSDRTPPQPQAQAQAPELTPTAAPSTAPSTQPSSAMLASFSSPTPTTSPAALSVDVTDLMSRGMAAKEEGSLLQARRLLNDAIQSPTLTVNDRAKCRLALGEVNQILIFSTKKFPDDEFGGTYSVKSGELLRNIADQHEVTWELLCRINGLSDPKKLRAGATIKILKGPFHAVVNKHDFMMDLYVGAAPGERGSMFVMSFPVGLGSDNSTPTGVWLVDPHKKLKNPTYYSPRGEGVVDAGDPKNPLGERWIGLTGIDGHALGKMSYGIHGTIEPQSIGKQSSMGCIRMLNEDVERVYDLLVEGKSQVVVKD